MLTNMCFNLMCSTGSLPDHFRLIPEKPIIVQQGGTGQIICEAEGVSVSKLQWKKVLSPSDEQSVPENMVVNINDNARNMVQAILKVTNAQPQDTGEYKCLLTAYDKATRKLTRIRVDGKLVISYDMHIMFSQITVHHLI